MKITLSREHRKILETTVAQARVHAEAGAEKTLKALAVAAKEAPAHASEEQKKLRVWLRKQVKACSLLYEFKIGNLNPVRGRNRYCAE